MRVPGLDSPVELSSSEAVEEETKLIETFKDLPSYKPLRLADMDPSDRHYAAEVTRQLLRQGKDGTLNSFVTDPSTLYYLDQKMALKDPKTGRYYQN